MAPTPKSKFKAILFDKDGTLVEFNGTWLTILEKLAFEVADGNSVEAARLLEIGGYDRASNSFLAGSELAAGTTETIVKLWIGDSDAKRSVFWKARLDRTFLEEGPVSAVPVPGLFATLVRLHSEGRKLAVVTNDLEAAARRTIENFGATHLFSVFLGYDSVKNPKPAADPVHLACEMLNISPPETVVVGDNLHDIEMARNAGAGAAIAVLTGTTSREAFGKQPDAILSSIVDLPDWLSANSG